MGRTRHGSGVRDLPEAVADLAHHQAGMLARRQLLELGIDRFDIRNHLAAGRWAERSALVVSTTTGALTSEQMRWLGVLHAGPRAILGGLTAAEVAGLRNWQRDEVTVLIPQQLEVESVDGVTYRRTRRNLAYLRSPAPGIPRCRIEPAVLLFGAYQRSHRTAQGAVAACIQQRLATAESFQFWVNELRPLRWARVYRALLADIEGGSQSLAEIDLLRLCRDCGLMPPTRQAKRRDASGRTRFTDAEWRLPDGRVVILEVDGSFHMDVEQWEDDLVRQRQLSAPGRTIVHCTARELREDPRRLVSDLVTLGVPVVSPTVRYRAR
jgi:hypothetical protein